MPRRNVLQVIQRYTRVLPSIDRRGDERENRMTAPTSDPFSDTNSTYYKGTRDSTNSGIAHLPLPLDSMMVWRKAKPFPAT